MNLQVVADGRHSVPTSIELQVDGSVRELTLPPIADRAAENATVTVPLHFPAMTGRRIRVTITGVRPQLATRESTGDTVAAPVGDRRARHPRLAHGAGAGRAAGRLPLRSADDRRHAGTGAGDRRARARPCRPTALSVTPCDPRDPRRVPTITLARGAHVIRTSEGVRTGLQLDRLVLASASGGGPLAASDGA